MKNREKLIATVCMLILSILFLGVGYFINKGKGEFYTDIKNKDEGEIFEIVTKEKNESIEVKNENDGFIVVDIKGAVKNPKEYKLKNGSRVRELIDIAGGLTDKADEERIYFSKILEDQQCIKIYEKGEAIEVGVDVGEGENEIYNLTPKDGKININKASIEQLNTLPGIGDIKAKSIVEYREKNGGFKSIEELNNIDGIGTKTVDKLRDKVDIK